MGSSKIKSTEKQYKNLSEIFACLVKDSKDKGVTVFLREKDRVSVMWGGCGLSQELQATGETPEHWGCSQKTNCSSNCCPQ